MTPSQPVSTCQQQGSALIVSLVMLTVLTLAASISMQDTTAQTRINTNYSVKQQVSTSAANAIDRTYGNLNASNEEEGSDVLDNLMALISGEKNALQAQLDAGVAEEDLSYDNNGLDPFSNFGWDQPDSSSLPAVASTTTQIYYDAEHPVSANCLLCNAGNSGGQTSHYPFRIVATAVDANGNIISKQVLGLTLTGAGTN